MSVKGLEIRVYFAGFQNSKVDQGLLRLLSLRMLQVTSGGLSYWGKAGTDIPEWAEDVDTLCPKSRKTLLTKQISEHRSVQCKCKLEKHKNTDWPSCLCYAAASCPQFMYGVNTYLEPPFHVPGMNFTNSINLQHKHSVAIFLLENRNVTLVFPTSTAFPSVTCYFFSWCKAHRVPKLLNVFLYCPVLFPWILIKSYFPLLNTRWGAFPLGADR